MQANETFEVNSVIWLQSLDEGERGPSRRMTEDLETQALHGDFSFEKYGVENRSALLDTLKCIALRAAQGIRPILHFDCHGSAEAGLLLAPSGEYLGWNELAEALRLINIQTRNNLVCVFGVCHGFSVSGEMSLLWPSPFFQIIAPRNEVLVGFLLERLPRFYGSIFVTKDLSQAFITHLKDGFETLNCQVLLARILAQYQMTYMSGRNRKASREALLSDMMSVLGPDQAPSMLGRLRSVIKDGYRMTPEAIQDFAQPFLIGRKPAFTVDTINGIIKAKKCQPSSRMPEMSRVADSS